MPDMDFVPRFIFRLCRQHGITRWPYRKVSRTICVTQKFRFLPHSCLCRRGHVVVVVGARVASTSAMQRKRLVHVYMLRVDPNFGPE